MPELKITLSEVELKKLRRLKENDKLGDKDWSEWIRHLIRGVTLYPTPQEIITKATQENLARLWAENFILNIDSIVDMTKYPKEKDSRSIGVLPKNEGHGAIVVGAGPSIHTHNHIKLLAESEYKGVIMTSDRMLIPLLSAGVTPERFPLYYVVTVDGNRELIPKFYDDPLLDEYGPKIIGLFAATSAPGAVQRLKETGGKIYWFLGMLDRFDLMDSVTGFMNWMTGLTAVSCLGNTGASCWNLAHYLRCNPLILIGMDLGYRPETPIEETAYYKNMVEAGLPTEAILTMFMKGYNPDFDIEYLQDPVFRHYQESFMEGAKAACKEHVIDGVRFPPVLTINATEGGSIWGEGVICMSMKEALRRYPK